MAKQDHTARRRRRRDFPQNGEKRQVSPSREGDPLYRAAPFRFNCSMILTQSCRYQFIVHRLQQTRADPQRCERTDPYNPTERHESSIWKGWINLRPFSLVSIPQFSLVVSSPEPKQIFSLPLNPWLNVLDTGLSSTHPCPAPTRTL